jgi:hypothetical protein
MSEKESCLRRQSIYKFLHLLDRVFHLWQPRFNPSEVLEFLFEGELDSAEVEVPLKTNVVKEEGERETFFGGPWPPQVFSDREEK